MRLAPGKPGGASYRLAQSLREQILQDRFAAEEPLPTEVALADEHALSRQTVRRAYLELVAERLQAPSGSPLLHIERLYRDGAGHPVELAISDFLPEHYSHRLRLGRAVSYSVTAAGGGPSP